MQDCYEREIDYLRVSVTDRCNLRCTYCMPAEGVPAKAHEEILTIEETIRVVRLFADLGIRKVRLTGGEPLVRKNIGGLVEGLKDIETIREVSMTTNGILLGKMARELNDRGLDRVNVSMDTLDPDRFREITRVGELHRVLEGIDQALAAGLQPVKVNVVAIRGFNDGEIGDFVQLAVDKELEVRFIELMPVGEADGRGDGFMSSAEILEIAGKSHTLRPFREIRALGPAQVYGIGDTNGKIGVIGAMSNHFCGSCNRMRLTADGKLRPCLHSSREHDLRALLRSGADDRTLMGICRQAIAGKPEKHRMETDAWEEQDRRMSQIGG